MFLYSALIKGDRNFSLFFFTFKTETNLKNVNNV